MAKIFPVNKKHVKVYSKKELDALAVPPGVFLFPGVACNAPAEKDNKDEKPAPPSPPRK